MKTAVLLLQVGTPDSPSKPDVRKYLRQFLMDARVMDMPWIRRQLLVNGIIVPFRTPKSAKLYREIWTDKGSPLLHYGIGVQQKLQNLLGKDFMVALGMRYQNPSIAQVMHKWEHEKPGKLIVIPLFPQYASSSSGTAIQETLEVLAKWNVIPETKVLAQYYQDAAFTQLWIDKGKALDIAAYDRVIFTFHGVPWRHIQKAGCSAGCQSEQSECPTIGPQNHTCYRAQCYANARTVMDGLNIPAEKVKVSFQSRLGRDPWLTPYTDHSLVQMAKEGVRKVLVFSMSFTADCLETIHEMGVENEHLFKEAGGEELHLIPSLNTDDAWIAYLKELVLKA